MTHLEIEIHDDEWADFDWLPSDAYDTMGSTIGVNWIRIRITDPHWITWFCLKQPQVWTRQDAA